VASFTSFKEKFSTYGNNFLNEKIFDNPVLGTGRGMNQKFDANFFGIGTMNTYGDIIRSIKLSDMVANGNFIAYGELYFKTGIRLSQGKYTAIQRCYANMRKKSGLSELEPISLSTFFIKIKKGSKNIRRVFDFNPVDPNFYRKNQQFKSFCKATNTNCESEIRIKANISLWNSFSFPNRFRVFLFKFYNNLLGTGNRIFHFNREVNVQCNFCVKNFCLPAPVESFEHVFFHCPYVYRIIKEFTDKYIIPLVNKNEFFHNNLSNHEFENKSVGIVLSALRYSIWQQRLAKCNLSFYTIELETINLLKTITDSSYKINQSINRCSLMSLDGTAERERERDGRGVEPEARGGPDQQQRGPGPGPGPGRGGPPENGGGGRRHGDGRDGHP